MPIPVWHPFMVHFPLALVPVAALALSLARLLRDPRHAALMAMLGTWNLGLGAALGLAAAASGLAAVLGLEDPPPAARLAVGLHVKWAFAALFFLVMLAVWRAVGAAQDARPSRLFLALLWGAVALLLEAGYRGGANVHVYGIGVLR